MNRKKYKKTAAFVISLLIGIMCFAQANTLESKAGSSDRNYGFEEFRRGVQAYYRGTFNEAVLLFEKALAYLPHEPIVFDWLGHAYYRSGIEGSAIEQWEAAAASGYGGQLLKNRIEVIKERHNLQSNFAETLHFVENAVFEGTQASGEVFKQPISVAGVPDGSFWVAAYGSNELVHFDINGIVLDRVTGSLEGFDRPFDILPLENGQLLVSEFAADRISLLKQDGSFIKSFGKKGRGQGECIGPQFLATDSHGNIFVTDFGNARVVVFSRDGTGLFTFGQRNGGFSGFTAPAGIAILDDLVYVADSVQGFIAVFDTSGNFIRTLLPKGSIVQAESIRIWKNNLLVSCFNKVYLVDINLATLYTVANLGNAPARVVSTVPDINGSLLLADYKNGNVQVFSHINELAGGLFVRFDRIFSDQFPNITVDVRVETRSGLPIAGLTEKNFFLSEDNRLVNNFKLTGSAHLNTDCDIAVIIERSPASEKELALINNALNELAHAMQGKGTVSVVSASHVPVFEGKYSPEAILSAPLSLKATWSTTWNCDLAVRLASSGLINAKQKRGIVFLSLSDMTEKSFQQYSLNDLGAYMFNNGIRFYAVNLKQRKLPAELAYLCKKTGGKHSYIYAEQGIAPFITDLLKQPTGVYQVSYTSALQTNFGKNYLPIELEVRLLNRSGRDEMGYFAPLD